MVKDNTWDDCPIFECLLSNHVLQRQAKLPLGMSIFNRVLHGYGYLRIAQAGFGCNCLKRETRVLATGTSFNQASKRTRLIAVAIKMC